MTIKDLCDAFGVSRQTVTRAIKSLYPEKIKKGKTTKLTKKEATDIGEIVKKKGYIQPVQNGQQLIQNDEVKMNDVLLSIKALADTATLAMQGFNKRLESLETRFEERKALLPAPKMSDRDNLNKVIRSYAEKSGINYGMVWAELYQEAYYRLNINLKVQAKNRNMSIIDYAEQNNIIPELLSIAMELFK